MHRLPPPAVIAYVAKWSAILAVAAITAFDDATVIVAAALIALLLVGLWTGRRVAWALLLVVELAILVGFAVDPSEWWVLPLSLAGLALILWPSTRRWVLDRVARMTVQRMDHVGIVGDDLAAAKAFFVELGLEPQTEGSVAGAWVDRVVGLQGVRAQIAMLETPDGQGRIELAKFHAPQGQSGDHHAPANTPGLRHLTFAVDDVDAVVARLRAHGAELVGDIERYEDRYRLCYVRGPEGILVELAERIG